MTLQRYLMSHILFYFCTRANRRSILFFWKEMLFAGVVAFRIQLNMSSCSIDMVLLCVEVDVSVIYKRQKEQRIPFLL